MVETFKIYKGEEILVTGKSPLEITGIEPNTTVEKGVFQATRVIDGKESVRVDIPAFKTLPIEVTSVSVAPKNSTGSVGTAGSRQLTATVEPTNATNKSVTFEIEPVTEGLVVSATGNITWSETVPAGIYTTTVTTEDGTKKDINTLTLATP